MAFKDRLKTIRAGKDLSQAALAEALGLSPAAIGGYENGSRTPKDNIFPKIAEYFGVSEDWLRRGALITDKQRAAIMARFEEPIEWLGKDADLVGVNPMEVWQALKSRAPFREDRAREIAAAIGTSVDDILEDPALMEENTPIDKSTAEMLQELDDKHHGLLQELWGATPEQIAEIQQFVAFVKSKQG